MSSNNSLMERGKLIAKVAYSGITHNINPHVQQLILHVTKRCNFRCKHCFVDFSEVPRDLTLAEIETIAQAVGKLIWLDIGGGEPFLRKDLVDIVSLFKFEELSIPTNGWFQDQILEQAQKLAALFQDKVTVLLSMDGPQQVHDEIRGQPGSFDRLLETFQELRKIPNIRVCFLSTLCERNADELLALIDFTESLGPDYHAVNILRGDPLDPTYRLDLETVKHFWGELENRYLAKGYSHRKGLDAVPLNYIRLRWTSAIATMEQHQQIVPCLGGTATIVIHPNGEVAPCETLTPVASVKQKPLAEILQSPEWNAVLKSIQKRDCFCTHECNLKSSIFLNPSFYPNLIFGQ